MAAATLTRPHCKLVAPASSIRRAVASRSARMAASLCGYVSISRQTSSAFEAMRDGPRRHLFENRTLNLPSPICGPSSQGIRPSPASCRRPPVGRTQTYAAAHAPLGRPAPLARSRRRAAGHEAASLLDERGRDFRTTAPSRRRALSADARLSAPAIDPPPGQAGGGRRANEGLPLISRREHAAYGNPVTFRLRCWRA